MNRQLSVHQTNFFAIVVVVVLLNPPDISEREGGGRKTQPRTINKCPQWKRRERENSESKREIEGVSERARERERGAREE